MVRKTRPKLIKSALAAIAKILRALRPQSGLFVEILGAASVVAGIAMVSRPAAFIAAGITAIFAIERQPPKKPGAKP